MPTREADGRIVLAAPVTDGIQQAYASGRRHLSVEFKALREARTEGGIREVQSALVDSVAMVRSPEYAQGVAEIRRYGFDFGGTVRVNRRISCKCADGQASEVEFTADAFRGVSDLDVTAIARGAESVIASTATDSLTVRRLASGALAFGLSPLATEAGRRTRELLDVGQPVYFRPVWTDASEFEVVNGVATVSRAWFQYVLVRPVPEGDAQGLQPIERARERRALSLARRALIAGAA